MTTIGAATHSPPAIRSQPPAPSPKKAGPDNDGDEGTDARMQGSFKWSFSSKNIWDVLAD